jgi:hypothetical protein
MSEAARGMTEIRGREKQLAAKSDMADQGRHKTRDEACVNYYTIELNTKTENKDRGRRHFSIVGQGPLPEVKVRLRRNVCQPGIKLGLRAGGPSSHHSRTVKRVFVRRSM